jgi:hypothetical protein
MLEVKKCFGVSKWAGAESGKRIPRRLKSARDDKKKGVYDGAPFGKIRAAAEMRPFATRCHFFFADFDFLAGCDGAAGAGFAAFILPWRMARRRASQSFTVWFA